MCGIIGTFPMQKFSQVAEGVTLLTHRGPDERSIFELSNGTVGHTRLAILDVSGGHQPIVEQDSYIVFNGEIYNYIELRNTLSDKTRTESDTEVILRLYNQLGPECIKYLDGMFAFAIYKDGELFLARDPLGIKPLYYSFEKDGIWFASEIKSLLGKTTNIKEFPPGFYWHSEKGFKQYYNIYKLADGKAVQDNDNYPKITLQIRESLREAVYKRLIADLTVPVGVSLSGGLDSSIVTALAKEGKEKLDTFVVGTPESDDIEASCQVSKWLNTKHHIFKYSYNDIHEVLPEVIYHLESYDAPLVRSAIPNYFLAKLASDHVKVILLGEGADELFAGYEYMFGINDSVLLDKEIRIITNKLHNTNLQRADRMTMAHSIEGRVPFLDSCVIETALKIPANHKIQTRKNMSKELLRESVSNLLPDNIVWRPKKKYSEGAGSIDMLVDYANKKISDNEIINHNNKTNHPVRSKEELLYFYIFKDTFGDRVSNDSIGLTRSITKNELN